jgi:hypothetical protein
VTVEIKFDVEELLRYQQALNRVAQRRRAISAALNDYGAGLVNHLVRDITQQTGLSVLEVRKMLSITTAVPSRLEYIIDMEAAEGDVGQFTARRMPGRRKFGGENIRGRTVEEFAPGQLVKVVTADDGQDCEICTNIAERSPYTIEQAKKNIHHGATIGLNNCRCILVPWVSTKKADFTIRERGDIQRTVQMSIRQLARELEQGVNNTFRLTVR